MIPWVQLDVAAVGDGEPLRLMRRGSEYAIMTGSVTLMSSRSTGSEEALARLVCPGLKGRSPSVLIGGLGMGFTLRAALQALGPKAAVTVAELAPAVIAWAKGPLQGLYGDTLADPRVVLLAADVGGQIRLGTQIYDAILLDVDNGPDGLTRPQNDGLYSARGLSEARAALRPGGRLAVWSSAPSAPFTRRLRNAGFEVEEVAVRAHAGRGSRHILWKATRP